MGRVKSIDVLKGIGIILVVVGHLNPGMHIERWIYSFHMFLFFFLSGMVFKRNNGFVKTTGSYAKQLLLPFLLWNTLAVVIGWIINDYDFYAGLKSIFYIHKVSWNSPVWFLVVLFWIKLFFNNINIADNIIVNICLVFLCIIIGYFDFFGNFCFGLNVFPTCFIFFIAGYLMKKYNLSKLPIFVCILMFTFNLICSQFNARISVYGCYYGNYILCILIGMSGVFSLYCIVNWLNDMLVFDKIFNCFEYVGKYSLNIMCLHYFLLRLFAFVTVNLFNGYDIWQSTGFIKSILVSFIIICIQLIVFKLLKKYKFPNSPVLRI